MNKYLLIVIVLVVILSAGVVYRNFFLPKSSVPVDSGHVKEITIIAKKNEWRFIPEAVDIARGDTVIATVINEDDYDHGIAIDAFGVSQRMPAHSTITLTFTATQAGDFPFYCSVPCGEGDVNGGHRTHFDMIGTIHVQDMISNKQ